MFAEQWGTGKVRGGNKMRRGRGSRRRGIIGGMGRFSLLKAEYSISNKEFPIMKFDRWAKFAHPTGVESLCDVFLMWIPA